MYGRKTPSTYRSTPSVYSHYTGKSSTNLRSSKSVRSLRLPWYQKPILHDAFFLDLQRGSLLTGFLTLFMALFTFAESIFDLYCLYMATPGFTHTGYYVISYQFVYVGSPPVRNVLIIFALFSWLGSVAVLVTSIILINALRKRYQSFPHDLNIIQQPKYQLLGPVAHQSQHRPVGGSSLFNGGSFGQGIFFNGGIRETHSALAVHFRSIHSVPPHSVRVRVHSERHDIRVQRVHVSLLDRVLRGRHVWMGAGVQSVPRARRPDQVGGFGAFADGNNGVAQRVAGGLAAHHAAQHGVHHARLADMMRGPGPARRDHAPRR